MAHILTASWYKTSTSNYVTVNDEKVDVPYALKNGDIIKIYSDNGDSAGCLINGEYLSSSFYGNIDLSDTDITYTEPNWGKGGNTSIPVITINYTEQTVSTKVSVDLTTLPGWSSLSDGSHSITIVAKADGYRDSEPSAAVSVRKAAAPKTLEESTWAEIAQVSANKSWDAMGWKVGDTKTITLNGTVGTVALNNYQCKVYILGFDHNADKEGQGISFGLLEGADGKQLCLVDGNYNATTSSATAFTMNTSNTNSGGWKNCNMRNVILGSTDVANGDATSAAITNPASGTLMAALPSDLRAVLKPITKYTNNVGQSKEASAITPTVDYLPLLSEYEVFKTHTYANSNEVAYQAQYQYYANGKSKVKYRHNSISATAIWWLRSPCASSSHYFCRVKTGGTINADYAYYSIGVAPAFLV